MFVCRPNADKIGDREIDIAVAKSERRTIQLVVRRGALRRYDQLKKSAEDLPVNIAWDRRLEERRQDQGSSDQERRVNDRRKRPPFTWESADFVVVESETPAPKQSGKPVRKPKSSKR